MKRLIPIAIAAALLGGSAYAQSINLGPGGVSIDPRSDRERAIDRAERDREIRREQRERMREREARREWREDRYGRPGRDCRTVTRVRDTPRGEIRHTTRVCD